MRYIYKKTLGVPSAEKYPLNLMQLVLPKGKVSATSVAVFSYPVRGNLYSFSNIFKHGSNYK